MNACFDWYTASIDQPARSVIDAIADSFDLAFVRPTKPVQGFEQAYQVIRGETKLATIQFGGKTVGTAVWACASGGDAEPFAEIVRREFPVHRVLRADVALDYDEPGAWDVLSALAIQTADKFRLKVEHQGDFHRQENGRTLKIGSRQSPAFQRVYEKGKQLKIEGRPDWVRSELELKPQTVVAREAYATASPEQMFMATRWTRHVWEVLNGPSLEMRPAPPGTVRRMSDDDRALTFMVRQYGNVLGRKLAELGGDLESFGLYIADLVAKAQSDEGEESKKAQVAKWKKPVGPEHIVQGVPRPRP